MISFLSVVPELLAEPSSNGKNQEPIQNQDSLENQEQEAPSSTEISKSNSDDVPSSETQDENSFKIISSKVEKVSSNESEEEEEEEEEIEYKISIKLNKKDTNISSLSISFYGHNIDGLLFEKENVEITSSESDSSSF